MPQATIRTEGDGVYCSHATREEKRGQAKTTKNPQPQIKTVKIAWLHPCTPAGAGYTTHRLCAGHALFTHVPTPMWAVSTSRHPCYLYTPFQDKNKIYSPIIADHSTLGFPQPGTPPPYADTSRDSHMYEHNSINKNTYKYTTSGKDKVERN